MEGFGADWEERRGKQAMTHARHAFSRSGWGAGPENNPPWDMLNVRFRENDTRKLVPRTVLLLEDCRSWMWKKKKKPGRRTSCRLCREEGNSRGVSRKRSESLKKISYLPLLGQFAGVYIVAGQGLHHE